MVMPEPQTGRVTIEEGVEVGRGGGRALLADVFTPPQGTANRAGVLLVHGGGWARGDRAQLRGYGILLGRIGYTCVACEYRLSGEAQWPAQIHDVKAALRWMRTNAASLGFDAGKLAVSGNSAGGHLSLMVAATANVPEFEGDGGNAGVPTDVSACIAFYAPAVLGVRPQAAAAANGAEASPSVVTQLMGADASEERLRAASPLTYARADFPPTALFSGNKDELVPVESSLRMYRALSEAGAKVELHIYEGAPHAFDRISEFGRQSAAIMALFLDRHVVNPRAVAAPVVV
jgi:acetyl esterase/lipase